MGKNEPRARLPLNVASEEHSGGMSVLHLVGALRWPVAPELRQRVEQLLRRGDHAILIDLAGVTAIDAAGVGELVRLRALAELLDRELWIENPGPVAHALLVRAGLLERLGLDAMLQYEKCS